MAALTIDFTLLTIPECLLLADAVEKLDNFTWLIGPFIFQLALCSSALNETFI